MNELKEQIDKALSTIKTENDYADIDTYTIYKAEDDIMQLIETYTSKRELEARLDELAKIGINKIGCEYYIKTIKVDSSGEYIKENNLPFKNLTERFNQLSSQLTNNKEGIEK